jgi:hypothetical protein
VISVKVTILMPAMRGVMRVPDQCATFRFSTAGLPKPARAQAVRDLHQRERTILPAGLEPIEPLVPLADRPLQVDVIKRTLPGLAVVSGTLSGVCHAPRPKGAAGQGEGDLLLAVNVWGSSLARQRDAELSLRDGTTRKPRFLAVGFDADCSPRVAESFPSALDRLQISQERARHDRDRLS